MLLGRDYVKNRKTAFTPHASNTRRVCSDHLRSAFCLHSSMAANTVSVDYHAKNIKVFHGLRRGLTGDDPAQFIKDTKYLTTWADNRKAYYPQVQPMVYDLVYCPPEYSLYRFRSCNASRYGSSRRHTRDLTLLQEAHRNLARLYRLWMVERPAVLNECISHYGSLVDVVFKHRFEFQFQPALTGTQPSSLRMAF